MKTFTIGAFGALALALAACGGAERDDATMTAQPPAPSPDQGAEVEVATAGPQTGSMEWAVAGDWRSDEDKARDGARHPVETLAFFGIAPDHTVVEMWPGGGWYSQILAPYLAAGGGKLIAAGFDADAFEGERRDAIAERMAQFAANLAARPDLYGSVEITAFSGQSGPLAETGSVDAVLTFRNLHNWMNGEYLDKFFNDAFAALRPGGVLGVVEHRLPSTVEQDPTASSGYMHEDFVKAAAARAGFEFAGASEVNANPNDTADHPFGVWTLPPNSRTQDRDGNEIEGFDPSIYAAIGESDRMTLKFVKPE